MDFTSQMIMPLAVAITTLGGAYLTVRKISRDARREKKEQAAEILQAAKEEMSLLKAELEGKIEHVETNLNSLEKSVEKDLSHIRETYNGEIKNLGQKIEDLRSELRNQHGQLVALLTKMIDNRD
jgi:chromosome segregation ATPase